MGVWDEYMPTYLSIKDEEVKDSVMKNGCDYCEGFICKDVHRCIRPNDKDCSENCEWYCNCQACRYDYDAETDECYPKKSEEDEE